MTADAVGGVWNYALSLIAGLPWFRFVLAVMGPAPDAAQREALARLPNAVLEERPYRLEWMAGAEDDIEKGRDWLARLVRSHAVDLVHVNGYAHARLDCDCPVLAVAHSDVLSWWRAVHGSLPPPEWGRYRDEVTTGLVAADPVVALTHAGLDDLRRNYGLALDSAVVIANGIDVAAYRPKPKRDVVIGAGRLWDAAKNLTLLDDAASALTWPVKIAGDAAHPQGGDLRFDRARLLGRLRASDLAVLLASAAIYAAPAKYEPFGLGILEAAASGCALVLGDIPSLRETWDGAARFVDPHDASELSDALRHLIDNRRERERLSAAARQRAGDFSRQRMAGQYAALYRALLSEAPVGVAQTGEAA